MTRSVGEAPGRLFDGSPLSRKEALAIYRGTPTEELLAAAARVRRRFGRRGVSLCAIHSVRKGRCGEDCLFCAQSSRSRALLGEDPFSDEALLERAKALEAAGVRRLSLVASGRGPGGDFERWLELIFRLRRETTLSLCASFGLIDVGQARRLREAGLSRYHCNLETSERFFSSVCSSHSFSDKAATLRAAREAGLSLCSGGIVGLGESDSDHVDLGLALADLAVDSVPVNLLHPIAGTPLASRRRPEAEEALRFCALLRLLLPRSRIRLAGGRAALGKAVATALSSSVDALLTGDYLTTTGSSVAADKALLDSLGLEVAS